MRKIPHNLDNPFDNFFIELSDITSPYAYNLGMTPNMITTLSNVACIITILLLLNANYYWAAFFVLISYYFDCMDGFMARKYKMTSVFGDYYDHISDFVKFVALLATLYYINHEKFYTIIPIIILLGIMMTIHMGCQELLYEKNESDTLKPAEKLCPVKNIHDKNSIKNILSSTRFFGCGTFYFTIALSIIYYSV